MMFLTSGSALWGQLGCRQELAAHGFIGDKKNDCSGSGAVDPNRRPPSVDIAMLSMFRIFREESGTDLEK